MPPADFAADVLSRMERAQAPICAKVEQCTGSLRFGHPTSKHGAQAISPNKSRGTVRQINAAGLNCMQPQGFGSDFVPKKMLRQKRSFRKAGGIPPGEEIEHRCIPRNDQFPNLGGACLRHLHKLCEQIIQAIDDASPQGGCIPCLCPLHAGENVCAECRLRISPPSRRDRAALQLLCHIEPGRNGCRPYIQSSTKRLPIYRPVLRHSGNALHHDLRTFLRQLYAGLPQHSRLT